ncbi:hypothetical protein C8F04DRAFT_14322 [Mycena alexandri]|uniref:Uncharacterized protein n=1 Tax=Mycena alexandri TaxID=1745969 RepID=A0AAD6TL45_9AGAR|nr:hypothetical protein C8F04DRAFT_14322 [Mycena alexandri]
MEAPLNMSLTPSAPSLSPAQAATSLSAQSSNLFQNAAGFNIIGGQFVSGDFHTHHPDPKPGSPSPSIPSFDVMDETFSESEIYCNQLMRRRRGFPLYVPGPPENLPAEYRRHGVGIGDVGSVTPEGIFDFCFNIYLPADHPINDDDVPENFQPLMPFASKDLTSLTYAPGDSVSTSSVQRSLSPVADFPGSDFVFSCGTPQGAVLALPHGAHLKKLKNLEAVREYVTTHAESWYKYMNGARGRGLQNGSLYLVTGYEKSFSWGMASFYSTSDEFQLVFRQTPRADSTLRYGWSGTRGRSGPSQHKSYDSSPIRNALLNQTTFIHGLSISLGIGIWGKLFGKVGIREIVESRLGSADRNGHMSHSPGSSPFSWYLGPLGGGGGSGGGRSHAGNVALSEFPPVTKIFHPADIINSYLLEKTPDATVIMSHDDDWSDILADDPNIVSPVQTVSELIRRINDEFSIITEKNGATFLRSNRSQADSAAIVLNPLNSPADISTTAEEGSGADYAWIDDEGAGRARRINNESTIPEKDG